MSEQEKTEATILVGDWMTREELLGEPEDITFLQSKRPHQVNSSQSRPVPGSGSLEIDPGLSRLLPPEDPDDPDPTFAQPKRPLGHEGRLGLAEPSSLQTEPPFRPIGHIGKPGSRRGLCGAEILGIKAFGEFDLCLRCKELNGGDPREIAARG